MAVVKIPVGIKIIDSVVEIRRKMLFAIRDELNSILPPVISKIQTAIQNRSRAFFETHPTTQALIRGPLNYHFGFPKGEELVRVGAIIQTVINNIEVSFKRISVLGGNRLGGGITVGVILKDFSDVLANPEGIVVTDKGDSLPWVEWLLIRGDEIIISDYVIRLGNYTNPRFNSRSGGAIMVEKTSGMWRVPPQYSGTANNNWLLKCILDAASAYEDMVANTIEAII